MKIEAVKKHLGYYVSLLIVLILATILILQFSFNKQLQMLTVVITTLLYIIFGIIHHKENHDLTAKIVIEYVLIGSLGMIIVSFLLKGGI